MFAVRAAHAFDGENFRAGGGTVLMEEGRIVGVEPVGYEPPSDCQLVDYGNATVLPGLIDTHVHLVGDSGVMAPALVAASSSAAAAIGLSRSKGRLRRGSGADVLVVDGDLASDLTTLRHVRQVVLRGVPVSPRSGQS